MPEVIQAFTNQNKCAINLVLFNMIQILDWGNSILLILYLVETIVFVLFSDLNKSKSEDKTLLAITIKAISRKIRFTFFKISRFLFGSTNIKKII
ncbi:hypothetical protein LX78_00498 [Xanthomarina spongicola]|jgi:hypothetical protein|uniref:Uncharacterized protein n=1 Tax=Xanthomarina spongicola TaxID=570520 RepID=A0A316DS08_9FLAO|nr:hypothetical protein LX78_00498 [Xanthomarina spongicola]